MDEKTIFDKVYKNREWGDGESVSGTGSYLESTKHLIRELPFLFSRYGIRSILDIPCGDFNWMKEVNLSGINYIGADIVKDLIESNRVKYPEVNFQVKNVITDDLPQVDMIICRDCFFHFPYDAIKLALKNIRKSNSKFLLTTSHTWKSFPPHDINFGEFRKLNLEMPPISLPTPIDFIVEGINEKDGYQADRAMCLWNIYSL